MSRRKSTAQRILEACGMPDTRRAVGGESDTTTNAHGETLTGTRGRKPRPECATDPLSELPPSVLPRDCAELHLARRDVDRLRGFGPFTGLESLWLNDNRISAVTGLDTCTRLKGLHLQRNRIESVFNCSIAHMRHLEVLNLADNRVRDLKVTLGALRHLRSIRELSMSGNPVSHEEGYRARVLETFPTLEMLDGVTVSRDEREAADSRRRARSSGAGGGKKGGKGAAAVAFGLTTRRERTPSPGLDRTCGAIGRTLVPLPDKAGGVPVANLSETQRDLLATALHAKTLRERRAKEEEKREAEEASRREEEAIERMTKATTVPPPRGVQEAKKEASARLSGVKRPSIVTKNASMTTGQRRDAQGGAIPRAGAGSKPARDVFVQYRLREKVVAEPIDEKAREKLRDKRTGLDESVLRGTANATVKRKFKAKAVGL